MFVSPDVGAMALPIVVPGDAFHLSGRNMSGRMMHHDISISMFPHHDGSRRRTMMLWRRNMPGFRVVLLLATMILVAVPPVVAVRPVLAYGRESCSQHQAHQ